MPERFELFGEGFWLRTAQLARGKVRVVLCKYEEQHRRNGEHCSPNLCNGRPAHCNHHDWSHKFGHRRAHIAHAEKAERRSLLFLRKPFGDISDADRKSAACKPESQSGEQHHDIGVGIRKKEGRRRRGQHGQRKDQPPAILVRPYS